MASSPRADGRLGRLPVPEPGGEDYGSHAFLASVDILVIGRATFETVLQFGVWPYVGNVSSSSAPARSASPSRSPLPSRSAPAHRPTSRPARGAQHVYLDGGRTIQGFLAAAPSAGSRLGAAAGEPP
jgi:hypothetical protein